MNKNKPPISPLRGEKIKGQKNGSPGGATPKEPVRPNPLKKPSCCPQEIATEGSSGKRIRKIFRLILSDKYRKGIELIGYSTLIVYYSATGIYLIAGAYIVIASKYLPPTKI